MVKIFVVFPTISSAFQSSAIWLCIACSSMRTLRSVHTQNKRVFIAVLRET